MENLFDNKDMSSVIANIFNSTQTHPSSNNCNCSDVLEPHKMEHQDENVSKVMKSEFCHSKPPNLFHSTDVSKIIFEDQGENKSKDIKSEFCDSRPTKIFQKSTTTASNIDSFASHTATQMNKGRIKKQFAMYDYSGMYDLKKKVYRGLLLEC